MYSFLNLEPIICSILGSNCCFLTHIKVSQETSKMLGYFHHFKSFQQFVMVYTVKGFSGVNEMEVDVSLECPCFLYGTTNVGNLILVPFPFLNLAWTSGSSWF